MGDLDCRYRLVRRPPDLAHYGEIIRAVTILVVFCPCALVLATPTAIMAAIGKRHKTWISRARGDAGERLAAVRKISIRQDRDPDLRRATGYRRKGARLQIVRTAVCYALTASVSSPSILGQSDCPVLQANVL